MTRSNPTQDALERAAAERAGVAHLAAMNCRDRVRPLFWRRIDSAVAALFGTQ